MRPGETRDECIRRLEQEGRLDPDCAGCKEFYAAAEPTEVFAPSHRPSHFCQSGQRPHCTCDTCF